MEIIVCVKPVPDPEKYQLISLDPVTKRMVREGIPMVINPADVNALEAALQLKAEHGGTVTVLSMAPPSAKEKLKECLAMGADRAYLVSDRAFAGADTLSTSYTLAKSIEHLGITPDLVLLGQESADGSTAHVPAQLGKWMGLPHISGITTLQVKEGLATLKKKYGNGAIEYEVKLPAVLGIARGSNKPRLITAMGIIKAKNKPLDVLTRADMDMDGAYLGLTGSPTQPGELHMPEMGRNGEKLEGDAKEIACQILGIIRQAGIQG